MWIPKSIVDWITSVKLDEAPKLREENSALRAERDVLKFQLQVSQNQFDWLRMQVNTLQLERMALLEKAYGIKVPAPEIIRVPVLGEDTRQEEFSFEDVGEEIAKQLGYPVYGTKQ